MARPKRPGEIACYRTRAVAFTERDELDELAFGRVLREFCPQTVMFEMDGRHPDYEQFTARIPNIPSSRISHIAIYMPSPGQRDTWTTPIDIVQASKQSICRFVFHRGNWAWATLERKWVFDPPSLSRGSFVAWYPCNDAKMKKFAIQVFRLPSKITRRGGSAGLDAVLWSQTGGVVRRSIGGGYPSAPTPLVQLNKYYDDSLWDDRLPEESTMGGVEFLEWHEELRRERGIPDPKITP
jgi:hypothetical protein